MRFWHTPSYKEQYLLHCNRLNKHNSIYNKVIQVAVPRFFQTIFVHIYVRLSKSPFYPDKTKIKSG